MTDFLFLNATFIVLVRQNLSDTVTEMLLDYSSNDFELTPQEGKAHDLLSPFNLAFSGSMWSNFSRNEVVLCSAIWKLS